jgi:hypothetical protein
MKILSLLVLGLLYISQSSAFGFGLAVDFPNGSINFGQIEVGGNSWESGYNYTADQTRVTLDVIASQNFDFEISASNFQHNLDGSEILGASAMQWNCVYAGEDLAASPWHVEIGANLEQSYQTSIFFLDGAGPQYIYRHIGAGHTTGKGIFQFQFLFGFVPPADAKAGGYTSNSPGILLTLTQ